MDYGVGTFLPVVSPGNPFEGRAALEKVNYRTYTSPCKWSLKTVPFTGARTYMPETDAEGSRVRGWESCSIQRPIEFEAIDNVRGL